MASNQYYITETDVSKMLKLSGLPMDFQGLFSRDYVAIKRDILANTDEAAALESRVSALDSDLTAIDLRLDTAEVDINGVESDLASHEADNSAHGATGDIVGTDDYCTLATGGTVKLAASVANATASAVNAVLNPNAAGIAYLQADAATWVAMLNEHKTNINQLTADLNAAITQLNLLMANSRTALQLEP